MLYTWNETQQSKNKEDRERTGSTRYTIRQDLRGTGWYDLGRSTTAFSTKTGIRMVLSLTWDKQCKVRK